MKHITLLSAVFALFACSPVPEKPVDTAAATPAPAASTPSPSVDVSVPPSTTGTAEDTCGRAQYAALIGKPATDPAVPPVSPAVRHITPGMQVTMDFRADRLNIKIGPDGKITEITCG